MEGRWQTTVNILSRRDYLILAKALNHEFVLRELAGQGQPELNTTVWRLIRLLGQDNSCFNLSRFLEVYHGETHV